MMTIRIETTDKVKPGDSVERNGRKYTVAEAVVWTDAADNYAYTEAVLKLARGGDGGTDSGRDK
jgi:hypothetical protein